MQIPYSKTEARAKAKFVSSVSVGMMGEAALVRQTHGFGYLIPVLGAAEAATLE